MCPSKFNILVLSLGYFLLLGFLNYLRSDFHYSVDSIVNTNCMFNVSWYIASDSLLLVPSITFILPICSWDSFQIVEFSFYTVNIRYKITFYLIYTFYIIIFFQCLSPFIVPSLFFFVLRFGFCLPCTTCVI